ncbi:MAG TPA: hypothetical protein VK473_07775 [Terriglobales bacterium]|nr:hypothetical protein [Terriglobales bacterium]
MHVIAISTRQSNPFPFLLTWFILTGIGLAQTAPVISPPLTLRAGTILTVRINQPLSSDRNQTGDIFSGSLVQPVIVQGIVVAKHGQTVGGQVVEAKKAGLVSGVSRLGITLTSLTLVDGQNVPIQSQLLVHKGPSSTGRDVAAVAGTTALGAAIGAGAGWGTGAAIGAGAGAAAGTLGVLLTRGYPSVIYPETLLTFQVTAPVSIETNSAPEAFRFVDPAVDYPQAQTQPEPAPPAAAPPLPTYPPPAYPPPAYPYPSFVYYAPPYYPYYYPYYGYPYLYGPSFSFFFGYPGYYGYHGYYGYRSYYGYGYAHGYATYRGGMITYNSHRGGSHGGGHH